MQNRADRHLRQQCVPVQATRSILKVEAYRRIGTLSFSFQREKSFCPSKRTIVIPAAAQARSTLSVQNDIVDQTSRTSGNENVLVMDVTKMMCGGCSASVKKILLQHPKVDEASVNLVTGTAVVTLIPGSSEGDIDDIIDTVSSKGFPSFKRGSQTSKDQVEKLHLEQERDEMNEYVILIDETLPMACADMYPFGILQETIATIRLDSGNHLLWTSSGTFTACSWVA